MTDRLKKTENATPKIKYDWYQTDNLVVVSIMVRGLKEDQVKIETQDHSLSVTAKLPNGSDYSLELDLAHGITPDKTRTKILSTKIEISMVKFEGLRWNTLEGDPKETIKIQPIPAEIVSASVPSSSVNTSKTTGKRDWDKLVADLERPEGSNEEEDGSALNELFRKIYMDGSDEVRRAMNKSFQESGGTVLSTDWGEVAKDKVEIKPPDGMEWKKWEQ